MPAAGPSALYSTLLAELGIPHGFSTRHGGCSTGMFASLNFGNPGDLSPERKDPAANIRQNWRRLTAAIAGGDSDAARGLDRRELESREIVEVHQVHGSEVAILRSGEPSPRVHVGHDVKADAMVTDDPRRLLAIRVADCTPILIASHDGRIVAAVHAGWRGVVGGVAPAAVRAMQGIGGKAGRFVAAIGPCIGPGAFEVGPEVAVEFRRVFGESTPHVRPHHEGKSLIELQGAIREQLVQCGLTPDRVETIKRCTYSEPAAFYSHRRDKGLTGRMVGIIGPSRDAGTV